MSKKQNDGPDIFELKLANGKTRKFKTGYDMWRWASQGSAKMEFYDDSKDKKPPTLSEWFERRRPKNS